MDHHFRDPFTAAIIGGSATIAYIYIRSSMNNEKALPNSAYFKPAFLVAFLVYIIVTQGNAHRESLASTPY